MVAIPYWCLWYCILYEVVMAEGDGVVCLSHEDVIKTLCGNDGL